MYQLYNIYQNIDYVTGNCRYLHSLSDLSGRIIMTCRKAAYAMIISVVFLITCVPLVGDNLIKGDDTIIHLIRLEGLKAGYLSGQLPVKVEPVINGGYGYAFQRITEVCFIIFLQYSG